MIAIASQQDAILVGVLGGIFLLLCGGGMFLTLRRGWFMTKYREAKITREENPNQFWFAIAAYLFGVAMGLYFIASAIFRSMPLA